MPFIEVIPLKHPHVFMAHIFNAEQDRWDLKNRDPIIGLDLCGYSLNEIKPL
jgi:hypothetical protein